MTLARTRARTRALRRHCFHACALLALPASAFAQSSRSPTIFSPEIQRGTVNVRAAVVRADYDVKALPLLTVIALRADRADSVVAQTDLDGRASMSLGVGTYTLRAKTAAAVEGRSYAWAVRVVVRAQRTETVQLTNANAVVAVTPDSVAMVVASVPAATSAPRPVGSQKPVAAKPTVQATPPVVEKPAATHPVPLPVAPRKVAAAVDSSRSAPAAPSTFADPFTPAPSQRVTSLRPAPRVAAPPARANTTGLLVGLSFDASTMQSEDLTRSTESGAGLAAQLGWGFTKNFAMVVDASAARISSLDGDFDLAHVDIGGRWHFVRRTSGFVPFVELGYSGRAASKQEAVLGDGAGTIYTGDLTILGSGASLGGGFQYFPTPRLAVGGALKWTTGKFTRVQFDKVTVDGLSIDATSARFNMGFTWFPMAGSPAR
jgi:hypothetical protein